MQGTGRTTRMLEEAIKQAKLGRAVYVVGASAAHARMLNDMCSAKSGALGIKFETASSLGNIDWENMRMTGAHPNCVLLVDHFAIESKFSQILAMLHRFDAVDDPA